MKHPLRIALLSVLMFSLFLVHEVVQEMVTKTAGWRFGLFMTFVEIGSCTLYPYLIQTFQAACRTSSSCSSTGGSSISGSNSVTPEHAAAPLELLQAMRDVLKLVWSQCATASRRQTPASPARASHTAAAVAIDLTVSASASVSASISGSVTEHGIRDAHTFTLRMIAVSSAVPATASARLQRAIWCGRLLVCALLILCSVSFANLALLYCSYPAKVAFKSAKLIPTMLIGALLLRKRYSLSHVFAAACLCVGLIGVTVADRFANLPSNHVVPLDRLALASSDTSAIDISAAIGISLLLLSILLDSIIPNLQEQLFNSSAAAAFDGKAPSSDAVMLATNLIGVCVLLVPLFGTGQLFDALAFLRLSDNTHLLLPLALFTLTSYSAVTCILLLTAEAGGVFVVALATVRKVVTIALSFCIFPKIITRTFVISSIVVLAGIVMGIIAPPPVTLPPPVVDAVADADAEERTHLVEERTHLSHADR